MKNVAGRADHGDGLPDEVAVEQPSWRPTAKVLAGWVTGAGSTTVLAVLALATDAVPGETVWGALVASVLVGAASWVKKNRVTDL